MEAIRQSNPEQIAFIGTLSTGSDYNNRTMLKLTDLITFYFNGPLTVGPQGGVNMADERLMYQPVCSPPQDAGYKYTHSLHTVMNAATVLLLGGGRICRCI